jgi:hypothetical protein
MPEKESGQDKKLLGEISLVTVMFGIFLTNVKPYAVI